MGAVGADTMDTLGGCGVADSPKEGGSVAPEQRVNGAAGGSRGQSHQTLCVPEGRNQNPTEPSK